MRIDRSETQLENADAPRIESREPDSNVRLARLVQPLKQDSERVSTDAEI
jgi:hypothetical protein